MIKMAKNYEKGLLNEYHLLELRNLYLEKENKQLKYEYALLEARNKTLKDKYEYAKNIALNGARKEYEEVINQLKEKDREIARLKSLLNNDGTNSGLSTSKTPLNKKKVIPNSRKKSNKTIGGQKGHPKHKLEKFTEEEINKEETIELKECPKCHGKLIDINQTIDKDVLDYKFIVIKKRVKFKEYKCPCCEKIVHAPIPNDLKEDNQYGPNVKTLILELLNEGTISINRVKRIIKGFSNNEIDLSEGYIAKVQKQAAKNLEEFKSELKKELIKQKLVYWDDTVISINKKQACLRFYGNEKIALYIAHERKNKEGIDKDNILNSLDNTKTVMHDHNKVNYNKSYSFNNIECNAHLQRDLQKVIDNLNHEWAKKLKELISESINKRNEYISKGKMNDEEFSKKFFEEFNEIMLKAIEENKQDNHKYYTDIENTLILRILDYKENYFAWVIDFELPTTNNLSERALRSSKTKMKISGQFQNIQRASDYANIKSYIETAYRNDYNPYEALLLLSMGEPLKISDIKAKK